MADMHTSLKELKSERIAMMMSPTELDRIDSWRFENRIGSRAKAMRILIASALAPSQEAETIKALREALEAIDSLEVMEINPSNYDHEIVCELNNNAVQASLIARAALAGSAS